MYLKKTYRKQSGRTYLVIAQKYRNPTTNISTDRTIKSLGYLDELEKEYDDPIAHFKEVARQMTEEENSERKLTLSINMDETLSPSTDNRKNFGYAAILKIYHELGLDVFFKNTSRHEIFEYNTNSIMIMLVISKLLSPGSKKKAFEEKDRYFERFNFSLADVYRSLSHFSKIATEFQRYLNAQIAAQYGRNTKADMGIITGDNIFYLQGKEKGKNFNGYVFSFSVRGGTKEFKEFVLSDKGYVGNDGKTADEHKSKKPATRYSLSDCGLFLSHFTAKLRMQVEICCVNYNFRKS